MTRQDIDVNLSLSEFLSGRFSDRANAELIQVTHASLLRVEAAKKKLDGVCAREDQPVVTVKVIDCLVEAIIVVELFDFDSRTAENVCAVRLERLDKVLGLGCSARDNDRATV